MAPIRPVSCVVLDPDEFIFTLREEDLDVSNRRPPQAPSPEFSILHQDCPSSRTPLNPRSRMFVPRFCPAPVSWDTPWATGESMTSSSSAGWQGTSAPADRSPAEGSQGASTSKRSSKPAEKRAAAAEKDRSPASAKKDAAAPNGRSPASARHGPTAPMGVSSAPAQWPTLSQMNKSSVFVNGTSQSCMARMQQGCPLQNTAWQRNSQATAVQKVSHPPTVHRPGRILWSDVPVEDAAVSTDPSAPVGGGCEESRPPRLSKNEGAKNSQKTVAPKNVREIADDHRHLDAGCDESAPASSRESAESAANSDASTAPPERAALTGQSSAKMSGKDNLSVTDKSALLNVQEDLHGKKIQFLEVMEKRSRCLPKKVLKKKDPIPKEILDRKSLWNALALEPGLGSTARAHPET